MLDIGKNLVEGLWNGINDAKNWVLGKIKGFGESILNGIKSFFGIASPSKLFKEQVGKNLALGVVDDFNDRMKNHVGEDRGVLIRYRKNLTGLRLVTDLSSVVTKIMPTGLKEDGQTLLKLPENLSAPNLAIGQYAPPGSDFTIYQEESASQLFVTNISDNGDDTISWTTKTITLIKCLMTTSL